MTYGCVSGDPKGRPSKNGNRTHLRSTGRCTDDQVFNPLSGRCLIKGGRTAKFWMEGYALPYEPQDGPGGLWSKVVELEKKRGERSVAIGRGPAPKERGDIPEPLWRHRQTQVMVKGEELLNTLRSQGLTDPKKKEKYEKLKALVEKRKKQLKAYEERPKEPKKRTEAENEQDNTPKRRGKRGKKTTTRRPTPSASVSARAALQGLQNALRNTGASSNQIAAVAQKKKKVSRQRYRQSERLNPRLRSRKQNSPKKST